MLDLWMWLQLGYMVWMVRQKGNKKNDLAVFPTVKKLDYNSFKKEIWKIMPKKHRLPGEDIEVSLRFDF